MSTILTRGVRRERAVAGGSIWLIVGLATVVAVGLRLPFLAHQSLWLDEIYTRKIVGEPNVMTLWHQIRLTESTPPLYYLVVWIFGGQSAAAMRSISAAALIAAVPVSYLAFRRFVGQRAAMASAALIAVNPFLVSFSTDARSYGLFVLTALLSVWALSELLDHSSWSGFAWWAASSTACIWTHYFGLFVVGAELVILLWRLPELRRQTALWSLAIAGCVAPLIPLATHQAGDERAEFIVGSPLSSRAAATIRQFAMGANVPRTWLEAAGLTIFALCVGLGIFSALRSDRNAQVLLAIAAVAVSVPLLAAALRIDDLFDSRNMIAVLPMVVALAAPAMLQLRAFPLVLYLALATLTAAWVASDWRYQQPDWRGALARAETIDAAAPVIAVTGEPVVSTYLDRQPLRGGRLLTSRVWIVVPPVRAAGHRAFGPAAPPHLPGFTVLRSLQLHAFTLTLASAEHQTAITANQIPASSLFPGRA